MGVENAETEVALSPAVLARIDALQGLQDEYTTTRDAFITEIRELEKKYDAKYQEIYEKRADIINGKVDVEGAPASDEPVGIPDFWLTALTQNSTVAEFIEEHDIPILKHLTNITSKFYGDLAGFVLEFHFSPNDYFENTVLTKTFHIPDYIERTSTAIAAEEENEDDEYGGEDVKEIIGCDIKWKPGKNVTVKLVKKKAKGKGGKVITKEEDVPSFFRFFGTPKMSFDDEDDDEVTYLMFQQIESELKVGMTIKDSIVPNAINWFTGEAEDEDDDDDYDDEDDSSDDDGTDEESDDDPQVDDPTNKAKGAAGQGNEPEEAVPECKSQ